MAQIHLSKLRRSQVGMKQREAEFALGALSDFELDGQHPWKLSHFLIEENSNSHTPALRIPTSAEVEIEIETKQLFVPPFAPLSYGVCPDHKRLLQLCGYSLQCDEHFVGVIEDFIIDTESWRLETFVVESFRNLSNQPFFYVPTHWILSVNHKDQQLQLWLNEHDLERAFRGQGVAAQDELLESYACWQMHQGVGLKGYL